MAEKKFRSWVGFREEEERAPIANPVDRIRDLESQLADLRSRRDITGLSREEFEILATETAMSMIKSAQAREAKATAAAERLMNESNRAAKDTLEGAENKARSILAGAESRGRKYISTAEAAENVSDYRAWLAEIILESERLYRSQASALTAAESAIAQSREKLDSAFARLARMQAEVDGSFNEDGTVKKSAPIKVESKRTRAAIAAPKKSTKSVAKKKPAKRK